MALTWIVIWHMTTVKTSPLCSKLEHTLHTVIMNSRHFSHGELLIELQIYHHFYCIASISVLLSPTWTSVEGGTVGSNMENTARSQWLYCWLSTSLCSLELEQRWCWQLTSGSNVWSGYEHWVYCFTYFLLWGGGVGEGVAGLVS